mgnify:CR=1 FL=1
MAPRTVSRSDANAPPTSDSTPAAPLSPAAAVAKALANARNEADRYARALGRLGASSLAHGEALAARGLHALARARGLVP